MSYIAPIETHLTALIAAAEELDGAMWPSVLDVHTRRYPEGDQAPQRVYRLIGAPRGSTLYWDQPSVVAAHALSGITHNPHYSSAADTYIQAFLDRCVSANGMFRWGNHMYYDVPEQRVIEFHGGPHELRPLTPAWELFWRLDPVKVARYLPTMVQRHIHDPETGGFNRHDDSQRSHAFVEAGGILAESIAWLHGKTQDSIQLETALRLARYTFQHRHADTGLIPNEPDHGRWDSRVCTTEIGLWAQCMLRAAGHGAASAFTEMAQQAVQAYLRHGYDQKADRYYGQVSIATGASVVPEAPGYWPGQYADAWNTAQWPTHDYPMQLAEACLSLHAQTGDATFLEAVHNWARIAMATSPGRTGGWAYAESYGRVIHLLTRAGHQLGIPGYLQDAADLAAEALDRLYVNGMFQGYPEADLYEAVDGVGYLLLALLYLETGQEPELSGFGF